MSHLCKYFQGFFYLMLNFSDYPKPNYIQKNLELVSKSMISCANKYEILFIGMSGCKIIHTRRLVSSSSNAISTLIWSWRLQNKVNS